MQLSDFLGLLGGLALFLYGMQMMSSGLEAAAGAAEGEHKASAVLSCSVLISCVLALVMALAGGLTSLPRRIARVQSAAVGFDFRNQAVG